MGSDCEMEVPNSVTRSAFAELAAGRGKRFTDVQALMDDLNESDSLGSLDSPQTMSSPGVADGGE